MARAWLRVCSSWQIIACLKSVDSGIRLAASNLAGVLAKDALYSKSIVFPESPTSADGERWTVYSAKVILHQSPNSSLHRISAKCVDMRGIVSNISSTDTLHK